MQALGIYPDSVTLFWYFSIFYFSGALTMMEEAPYPLSPYLLSLRCSSLK